MYHRSNINIYKNNAIAKAIYYITVGFIRKAIIRVVKFNKSTLMLKTDNWIRSEWDVYCYALLCLLLCFTLIQDN